MKNKFTVVFDIPTANILLAKGYKMQSIRPNKTVPNKLVFVFLGDLNAEVNDILINLGKREG